MYDCILIQLTISLLKQVYTRLEKFGLCLSSKSTLKLLDTLGMRHDEEVMEWVTALQVLTPTSHVSRSAIIELVVLNEMSSNLLSFTGLHIRCPNDA